LGTGHAFVVHSEDGLDEVTLSGRTSVQDVRGNGVRHFEFTPEDAGLGRLPLDSVKTGTAVENAGRVRAVVSGIPGPDRDYTLVNAAAALMVCGRVSDLKEGVALAAGAIASGAAKRVLDTYVETTRSFDGV
jgi:anthranilate phosphoribosyltransferase